jgi:hypothetical protein
VGEPLNAAFDGSIAMDDICLPVRFVGITENALLAHLRYCACSLKPGDRVEMLLCDAGVVIPVVKRVYQKKSPTLDILIRSGSIGRDKLVKLRTLLSAEGHDLKLSFTSKYKLLSRIVVPLPIEDGMIPVNGVNLIRSVAAILDLSWPCQMTMGYALGSEDHHLPGQIVYRHPYRNAGYQLGQSVGKLLRKVIS